MQLKTPASNAAQLVTGHASDCNSEVKRVVPSPFTMALRRTAYTPGTVRQSVILVLCIYLSRVKCKIDFAQFCKIVRLTDARSMGQRCFNNLASKQERVLFTA